MQKFINRQFFNLTLFTLIFGVLFYDAIARLGFSYIDEICAALLLVLYGYKVFRSKTWEFDRFFLSVLGIFLFYLLYSFAIHANSAVAIVTDFIIQLKPYIGFFCVYALRPQFSENQRKILREVIALCALYLIAVGIGMTVSKSVIEYTFVAPSRLATASSALALLYLYCSNYTKDDKIIFLLILAIGIFSTRSKHYGFFAICVAMMLYFRANFRMKLDVKNITYAVLVIGVGVFVAWNKIYYYFVTGGFGEGREATDFYARAALYYFSIPLLTDFFPFGSGFATYATHASGMYYSDIYVKYGINRLHGLTKEAPAFISDTYFPALAQFGFVGVALFFAFFIHLAAKAFKNYNNYAKEATLMLMIVIFFMIESTSDSTFTHNRGLFIMMLMGLLISDINRAKT